MIKKCLKETVEVLEHKRKNAKNLYMSNCVNWKGKTSDNKEYYTEVISRELLKNENINLLNRIPQIDRENYNVGTHRGLHRGDTNRAEEIFAMRLKGKRLRELGLVIDYQIPLKRKRSDDAGKIDLITTTDKFVYLIELKYADNKETLLRAILEIWTYYRYLNRENFLNSFGLPIQIKIRKAVLLGMGSNAYKEARDLKNRPELKKLAKKLRVDIFTFEEIAITKRR
jgi:hypothetical protein